MCAWVISFADKWQDARERDHVTGRYCLLCCRWESASSNLEEGGSFKTPTEFKACIVSKRKKGSNQHYKSSLKTKFKFLHLKGGIMTIIVTVTASFAANEWNIIGIWKIVITRSILETENRKKFIGDECRNQSIDRLEEIPCKENGHAYWQSVSI